MDNIITYFQGERLQCIIGLILASITIVISVYLLYLQKPVFKGFAYASLPLASFLVIICIAVIVRTPKDIERVTAFHQENSELIQTQELPRMQSVMKSFSIIKMVEIVVFCVGIFMAIFFWSNELVKGIALGLVVQGLLLYLFDHFAEIGRAHV